MTIRPLVILLAILLLAGCDQPPATEPPEPEAKPESATEELAALGALAQKNHPHIKVEGGITGSDVNFIVDYSPQKKTLDYQLTTPEMSERIVVSEEQAVRSVGGAADQKVNAESFMPNGKDWPYGSRMVAPFLDAIDAYAATRHSFHIANSEAPKDVEGAESLKWFSLKLNRDQAHDLLLLEFSKVGELKIGVEPKTGLLKSLYSLPNKGEPIPTEIRSN